MGALLTKIPYLNWILSWFLPQIESDEKMTKSKKTKENLNSNDSQKSKKCIKREEKKLEAINRKKEQDPFKNVDEPDSDDPELSQDFLQLRSCKLNMVKMQSEYEQGQIIFQGDISSENHFKSQHKENINEIDESLAKNIVKMPFHDLNNWQMIKNKLNNKFKSGAEVEDAIKTLNNEISNLDFEVLRKFLDYDHTFGNNLDILNGMTKLALELPDLLKRPLPLVRKSEKRTIFLSRKQIGCLLANAFFCLFPRRSKATLQYRTFPLVNFSSVFSSKNNSVHLRIKLEKLRCIFNYFKHILNDQDCTGLVSFERKCLYSDDKPEWTQSERVLSRVIVQNSGRMEISGQNYSVVDFANKYMGGGVLNTGAVQEEIMFLISPELLVSRVFMESLSDDEAIVITGHSVFNSVTGYSNTFEWTGDYTDTTAKDDLGRLYRQTIAIDAINYRKFEEGDQFEQEFIDRELGKAYVGFESKHNYYISSSDRQGPAIASGKWGCGAYRGDPSLKYLIQLLASSEAQRDLIFYTFRDKLLAKSIKQFNESIVKKKIFVKQIYDLIIRFKSSQSNDIFQFILDHL